MTLDSWENEKGDVNSDSHTSFHEVFHCSRITHGFPEEVKIILFSTVLPSLVFPTRSIPPQLCYRTIFSTLSCLHKKHYSFQTNHMITQKSKYDAFNESNLTSSVPLLKSFKVLYLNDFFKRSEWNQSAKERGFVYLDSLERISLSIVCL